MDMDELLSEYVMLDEVKKEQQQLIDANLDIQNLKRNIESLGAETAKLQFELAAREKPYLTVSNNAAERQSVIRTTMAEEWDLPTKTYRGWAGTATLRITKSLIVKSKQKIVDFLVKNSKVEERRNVTIKVVGQG